MFYKTSLFMLFKKIISLYSMNRTVHYTAILRLTLPRLALFRYSALAPMIGKS
jgi:hypothetical protein